jgi:membrane protease YdiL (CAAX protease family)
VSTLRALVRRHAVAAYFTLTFAVSWSGALLVIGSSDMAGTTPGSDPRFPYALLAMLAGPSLAGLVTTAVVHGRPGLGEVLRRLTTWRVSPRWYAVALLTAPMVMGATLLGLSLRSPAFVPGIIASDDRLSLLMVSLAVGLSAGLVEELGWTGFATPEMRRRGGVPATGFVLGLWWSAWHLLPNYWSRAAASGDLGGSIYMAASAIGIVVGYLTAFRVLMVWVYERTGSLLVSMLMHVSLTASLLVLNPTGLAGLDLQVYSFVLAAALWVVVAAVTVPRRARAVLPLR